MEREWRNNGGIEVENHRFSSMFDSPSSSKLFQISSPVPDYSSSSLCSPLSGGASVSVGVGVGGSNYIEHHVSQFCDKIINLFSNEKPKPKDSSQLGREKVRAVTRMLLLPSKSETTLFRRRHATCPRDVPYEALVLSRQDRLSSNIRLLHSAYSFIPTTRSPPINGHCADRNFAYDVLEELHHPWFKRLLIGFARTSDYSGPRKPTGPHHLIQEIESKLPVSQPALQLTHEIFGSCPPMRSFDPGKMLTEIIVCFCLHK